MNGFKLIISSLIAALFIETSFSQLDTFNVMMEKDSMPFDNIPVLEIIPMPKEKLEHPYLFFTKDDIQHLRVRANHPELYDDWQLIKENALDLESDRYSYANSILPGCLAFQITGEIQYAEATIVKLERLFNISYPWTIPDQNTNDLKYLNWEIGDKALAIAFAFDMLYEVMSEDLKQKCIDALNKYIYPEFASAHYKHDEENKIFLDPYGHSDWWTSCYFGWNSKLNGCIGIAALATLWDISDSPKILQMARRSLRYTHFEFNQDSIESGGYDEGPMAAFVHLGNLIRFYVALENVMDTDDDFFELPGLAKTPEFIMDFVGPDNKYVPFGSSLQRKVVDPNSELFYLADLFDNRKFANFIDENAHPKIPLTFSILFKPIYNDTICLKGKKKMKCYSDIHWGFINDHRFFVPFKGGDNAANLSQLDAGNMLLYLSEESILFSPMSYNPKTSEHNCIVVNNENQIKTNPKQKNYGGQSKAKGEIIQCLEFEENYLVSIDLSSCYNNVNRYHRHIVLSELGTVFVFDDVQTNEPSKIDLLWHSLHNIEMENDTSFYISANKRGMNVEIESNRQITSELIKEYSTKTILSSTNNLSKEICFFTLFSPGAIKQYDFETEETQNMITITMKVKNKSKEYIFFFEDGKYKYIRDYR